MTKNKRQIDGVWPETELPVDPAARQAAIYREEGATFLRLALLRFIAAEEHQLAERLDELIDSVENSIEWPHH